MEVRAVDAQECERRGGMKKNGDRPRPLVLAVFVLIHQWLWS